MDAREIINEIAAAKVVEDMVVRIAHRPLDSDLCDLSQMVYEALLKTAPGRLIKLQERQEMRPYISKIITNQLRSKTSRFHYIFRRPRAMQTELTDTITNTVIDEP